MNRRTFLTRLGFGTVAAAAAATGAIDIERLLWVPSEKTIFIPSPQTIAPLGEMLRMGDIFSIEGYYATNPITGKKLGILQHFIVTSTVSAGDVLPVEKVFPRIMGHGAAIDGNLIVPSWAGTH